MSSNLNKLSPQQLQAVMLAAEDLSGRAIASELKVAPETVSRWRQLPEFQAELNTLLLEARDETASRLRALTAKALDRLEGLLASAGSDAVKLAAARLVLDKAHLSNIGPTNAEVIRRGRAWDELIGSL